MNTPSLETLLEKLAQGESEAAERVFRDYEPFLRAMVRRRLTPMLRAKFDSMDVVQSAWADVLEGYREEGWRFEDQSHLRAFLARVTYNHFATLCRRNRAALEHEHVVDEQEWPGEPAASQPRPSQVAQADELWDTLMDLCPPAHRQVLELKGQGVPLAEIAERTGLHESSVRRILYDLARRLAATRGRSATE
jgi:RNA polymerase sigma-70 factor (ECF subfamily)